jgi:hypothetical protein
VITHAHTHTHTLSLVAPAYFNLRITQGTLEYLKLFKFSQEFFEVTGTNHITLHNKNISLFLAHLPEIKHIVNCGWKYKENIFVY